MSPRCEKNMIVVYDYPPLQVHWEAALSLCCPYHYFCTPEGDQSSNLLMAFMTLQAFVGS